MPAEGLIDVHRYLTIQIAGKRIVIDATFPGPAWDGRSSLQLSCGSGADFPAGADPDIEKRRLEAQYCDTAIREPFIAMLSRSRSIIVIGSAAGSGHPAPTGGANGRR